MPTWDELLAREVPCRRCGGAYRIAGPLGSEALAEVQQLRSAGRPISAIRRIRELTNSGLREAKGTYEHFTNFRGQCHRCRAQLPAEPLSECPTCGALNIDAHRVGEHGS